MVYYKNATVSGGGGGVIMDPLLKSVQSALTDLLTTFGALGRTCAE